MKKILWVRLVAFLASLLFSSSVLFALDLDSVVDANNKFAFELYSRYNSKEGNIFFSPCSISSALAMVYEGAKGKAADEILSVFHFTGDDTVRREGFLRIYKQINKKDKKYRLHIANALWAQKDYRFLEHYFQLIEMYYGGKVKNLDFANESGKSRFTINDWVEEQTNNKIKNLIPEGAIDKMTRLVLTNAIYFKGKWLRQFDEKNTTEGDFRVSPGNIVKARMMVLNKQELKYAETDELQILELPYEGEELSMLILLPKKEDLKALEKSLTPENLSAWRKNLKEETVNLYLPGFKFETKYFMAKDLQEMGMPAAFSKEDADFSGMTGKKDLFISEVIHQAFVEVNEEGTEAAAATAVVMLATASIETSNIKTFKADHPFIFIIREKETGSILFLGRVNNPAAALNIKNEGAH